MADLAYSVERTYPVDTEIMWRAWTDASALEQWYSTRYRQDYKGAVSPRLSHVLRAARLALERWDWASVRRV